VGLCWTVIVFGAIPRTTEFIHARSLWPDEAILAHHILHRPIGELLQPFGDSMAPPGYLLLTRASIDVFGVNERAARLPAYLAGLSALLLFYLVARRTLPLEGTVLGLLFFATSKQLILYSNEVRPYSLDTALFLLVVWLGLCWFQTRSDWKNAIWLAVAGALGLWFSFPLVFTLAGVGLVLGVDALIRRDTRRIRHLVTVGGVWILSFAVMYSLVILPARNDQTTMNLVNDYYAYAGAFMPFPPSSLHDLKWFWLVLVRYFDNPLGLASDRIPILLQMVAGAALFAGAIGLAWTKRKAFLLIVLPVGVALMASGLRLYPFYERTILWTSAPAFLCIGCGLALPLKRLSHVWPMIGVTAILVLTVVPTFRATRRIVEPTRHHELGRMLAYAQDHWQQGDVLFLRPMENMAFDFSKARFDFPPGDCIVETGNGLTPLKGHARVWIPLYYDLPSQIQPFLDKVKEQAKQKDVYRGAGASVYLFDFRGKSAGLSREN